MSWSDLREQFGRAPGWQRAFIRVMFAIGAIGFLLKVFGALDDPAPAQKAADIQTPMQPVAQNTAPQLPQLFYSVEQHGLYGYEQSISENDQKEGLMAKPLLMVRYLGKRDDTYEFTVADGSLTTVMDCTMPCLYTRTRIFNYGELESEQTTPNAIGSVGWEMFQDAENGYLTPYLETVSGKKVQKWYDEENHVRHYPLS